MAPMLFFLVSFAALASSTEHPATDTLSVSSKGVVENPARKSVIRKIQSTRVASAPGKSVIRKIPKRGSVAHMNDKIVGNELAMRLHEESGATITKYIYKAGDSGPIFSDTITGSISVTPNRLYNVNVHVLRNDLGNALEKVSSITLNTGTSETSLGSCNPDGNDKDCTFFNCGLTTSIESGSTGSINVTMVFQLHSHDCDCSVSNGDIVGCNAETKTWYGGSETRRRGYTAMEAVAKFELTEVPTPAPTAAPTTTAPTRQGLTCDQMQSALAGLLAEEFARNPAIKTAWDAANGNCETELAIMQRFRGQEHVYSGNDALTYESPLDLIVDKDNLTNWLNAQTWRNFTSRIPKNDGTTSVNIQYVTIREASGSKGAILVSPGNGEFCDKYDEILHDLVIKGYSPIYCIDHRGQGRSDRLLDDHFKAHVDGPTDYIVDFRDFVQIASLEMASRSADKDKPFNLICHSMGCAIAFTYLIEEYEAQRPQLFNAVAANAPLIKADTSPFPYPVAIGIGQVMVGLGQGEAYPPSQGKTAEEKWGSAGAAESFKGSTTTSFSRWERNRAQCIANQNVQYGVDHHTGLCVGDVTAQKAVNFFKLYDTFETFMNQSGKAIAPPLLIQQAGDPAGTDGKVVNAMQDQFCNTSASNCQMSKYPLARHNLWIEIDAIRTPALNEVDMFLQSHAASKTAQNALPDHLVLSGEECHSDAECVSRKCDSPLFDWMGGTCANTTAASDWGLPEVLEGDTGEYKVVGSVVYYPAKLVLPANALAAGVPPPMEVATPANMDPKLKQFGVDFEGIWWMSDNPVQEELVSFANTVVTNATAGFPITLMVPNSRKGMWSWLTGVWGTLLRRYYATGDPDAHTDFVFKSQIEGDITTGLTDVPLVWVDRFPFYKYTRDCNVTSGSHFNCDPTDCAPKNSNWTCGELIDLYPDDMWSRPTLFQERSLFTDTTYTLKRIVMGDGSAHPVFWNEFMEHMTEYKQECSGVWPLQSCTYVGGGPGEKPMQSYASDDWCSRQHDATWGIVKCP